MKFVIINIWIITKERWPSINVFTLYVVIQSRCRVFSLRMHYLRKSKTHVLDVTSHTYTRHHNTARFWTTSNNSWSQFLYKPHIFFFLSLFSFFGFSFFLSFYLSFPMAQVLLLLFYSAECRLSLAPSYSIFSLFLSFSIITLLIMNVHKSINPYIKNNNLKFFGFDLIYSRRWFWRLWPWLMIKPSKRLLKLLQIFMVSLILIDSVENLLASRVILTTL